MKYINKFKKLINELNILYILYIKLINERDLKMKKLIIKLNNGMEIIESERKVNDDFNLVNDIKDILGYDDKEWNEWCVSGDDFGIEIVKNNLIIVDMDEYDDVIYECYLIG